MNKSDLKNKILQRKISITIIIILLFIITILFNQSQNYKYTLLYQYQSIPHIELKNTLYEEQGSMFGEIRGFVKFDNFQDQPNGLKQYYIIKPLNKFDKDLSQYFSLEEIVAMQYLPPQTLGISEIIETNENLRSITLEDKNGNQFFIDKVSKEVSVRDVTGDRTTLVTSQIDYGEFIKQSLKK